MGYMLVFTNAADGRDDEFNDWYDNVHVGEVCAIPEFVGATRYEVGDGQSMPDLVTHKYLAIYEYEGSSAGAAAALKAAGPTFKMSDSMAKDVTVLMYEPR